MKNLDNRCKRELLYEDSDELFSAIERLEQKIPIERKLKFFLDIRGVLKVNSIRGSYVEYGCYQGETLFAAKEVFKNSNLIDKYFGVDIFNSDRLKLSEEDKKHNVFDSEHKFKINEDHKIFSYFKAHKDVSLIKGDLTNIKTFDRINTQKISIALIDCNFLSALKCSIDHALDNISHGGFIFIDDFFCNLNESSFLIGDYLNQQTNKRGYRCIDYKCYSPFAKSFLILTK